MNDVGANVKQQIVDKIKSSTNILVTVNKDPSVDDLSAAIGLTAMLNKLDKHVTAIFSGAIPPAITFLEPDKVFENTADSLRDFIIALDKEKADHLRYKVEGDVVKIFITPYRTSITSNDLEFSQGDCNVELVLALGVADQLQLDSALTAHGGILDNVTIATLSDGLSPSHLGNMDWDDKEAGSLSEMVAIISDSLKTDKPLLDKQIATALLTGIVAATDRFSNIRTSSRVMSTAAQLMAAGANQQLIAAKLQESHEISSLSSNPTETSVKPEEPITVDNSANLDIPVSVEPVTEYQQSTLPPDNFVINHDSSNDLPTVDMTSAVDDKLDIVVPTDTNEVVNNISTGSSLPEPNPLDYIASTLPASEPVQVAVNAMPDVAVEPTFGGTLNSTTQQASEDVRRELEDQQNTTILNHSYLSNQVPETVVMNGAPRAEDPKMIDIFEGDQNQNISQNNEPMNHATPVVQPPVFDMPLPPPLPDFSTLPPPPVQGFDVSAAKASFDAPLAPVTSDPSKFRIPGQ